MINFHVMGYAFVIEYQQIAIFIINILLFIFAKKIVTFIENIDDDTDTKVLVFRVFNVLFFVFQIVDIAMTGMKQNYDNILNNVSITFIIIYATFLVYVILENLIDNKFAYKRVIDGNEIGISSYSSRMMKIIAIIALIFFCVVSIIKVWGFNSMLETTGMIGILLGFFAFTSNIWAPDLLQGLILLNSSTIEDGDIVLIDGLYYIVYKTMFMESTLLNIQANTRTRFRNSVLASKTICNVTKVSHIAGVRETLKYNIGYPSNSASAKDFNERVQKLFKDAYEACIEENSIEINDNKEFEVLLTNTGDHALEYSVSFYINNIKKTRSTAVAREYLRIKYLVNQMIFNTSISHQISLATPFTHKQSL